MTVERYCAKTGCETELGPGGGVMGLCPEHAFEAALEALEAISVATGGLERHLIQLDTRMLAIERLIDERLGE